MGAVATVVNTAVVVAWSGATVVVGDRTSIDLCRCTHSIRLDVRVTQLVLVKVLSHLHLRAQVWMCARQLPQA